MRPESVSPTVTPATVYLVDDHAMIRASLRMLLNQAGGFEVVGDCGDPRAALQHIATLRPQVVLLDITMPGLSGIDLLPKIRDVHPDVRIVMVTHLGGGAIVDQSFAAGADGFVSKDAPLEELLSTVRAALRGERQVACAAQAAGTTEASALAALTPREREILQSLVLGRTNKEIGRRLGVSVSTIKKHRENLQRKLACSSTAELARIAIREGLIEP